MGCEQSCPLTLAERVENWELEDPAGKPLEFVRMIRDQIEQKIKALIAANA
jgi:protein-tyrosine-phosphatase